MEFLKPRLKKEDGGKPGRVGVHMPDDSESRPPSAPWRDLGLRALWAGILIPLALGLVWLGGAWFRGLILVAAVLMALEWCRLIFPRGDAAQVTLHILAGLVAITLPAFGFSGLALASMLALWAASAALLFMRDRAERVSGWAWIGVPYIAVPAAALVILRGGPEHGLAAIVWLLALVWATDSGAYFCGRLIGGPKLAPRLSPKKTWAGAVGGLAAACIVSVAVAYGFGIADPETLIVPAAALSIAAQAGDMMESAVKRAVHVKDSGTLIPGHGGILDRMDGLVAAAVAALAVGILRGGPEAAATGLMIW